LRCFFYFKAKNWTEDGIGYEVYAAMAYDWEHKAEAVKYLKSFIENIK